MRPSRIFISVDLPAPFAPTSPVTPGPTETVSPSSAVTFPGYTLVSALVSMTAGASVDGMVLPCQRGGTTVIPRQGEVAARGARLGHRPGLRLRDDAAVGHRGYRSYVRTTSDPPAPRPPLTMRIRPWQWTALDYVFGTLVAGFLFATIRPIPQPLAVPLQAGVVRYYHLPLAKPLVLLLVVAAGIAIALRRRRPVLM